MSPKEIRRKRGRPPATSPPASPRRHTSRASSERHDFEIKRRRDKSPVRLEQENEEDFSETDETGETKVDANGKLYGGREYKVATFKLPEYGEQELMLAMDPSKILGYRDSYLFFQRNPTLKRVRINEEEKNMLVGMGLLIAWFKGREVAVVTARSVFKRFGSQIIKNGRRVIDDYFEAEKQMMREEEMFRLPTEDVTEENKNRLDEYYYNDAALDNRNWIHHAALATRGFNTFLNDSRNLRSSEFYDIHSNVNQVPLAYQPQSCQFEFIKNQEEKQEPVIEYQSSTSNFPGYRGLGKDILDDNLENVLSLLPKDQQQYTREAFTEKIPIQTVQQEKDESYPLSLMDGQYQYAFPVHQARFNYPIPKIPEPNIIFDTAQSLSAQQYYLGVVYQTVNQYADPRRQPPPSSRQGTFSSPQSQQQPQQPQQIQQPQQPQQLLQQQQLLLQRSQTQHLQQIQPPQQQVKPQQPQQPQLLQQNILSATSSTPIIQQQPNKCNFKVSPADICGSVVTDAGLCEKHANTPKTMEEHVSGPPPPATGVNSIDCADCHQKNAPSTIYDGVSRPEMLVKCSHCTRKYHPICANLTTPKQTVAVESYYWLCPECKVCCACKTVGDESNLMICDGCDRGWHTKCSKPHVEHIPEGEWLCQLCAKCHGCSKHGMTDGESPYEHVSIPTDDTNKYPVYLATFCKPCTADFEQDRLCPVCVKTYSEVENDEEDNEMVACDTCDFWVHTRCDASLTYERYQLLCDDESAKYSCPMCENRVTPLTEPASLALQGKDLPNGICVGLLGGKVKTRGIVKYKNIKIGVPEIDGSGL